MEYLRLQIQRSASDLHISISLTAFHVIIYEIEDIVKGIPVFGYAIILYFIMNFFTSFSAK